MKFITMLEIVENIPQKKTWSKKWLKWLFIIILLIIILAAVIYLQVAFKYSKKIISLQELTNDYQVAMIFGAGLKARNQPGAVLEDRILTGIQAYQLGKVDYLLLSGDNSQANHNEVQAMKSLALEQGVPAAAILLDHAGVSTLDSCLNFKNDFEYQKVVLVTQKYHLRRALYICNELGIDAVGIDAAGQNYQGQLKFTLREIIACLVDFFEVKLNNQ